MLNEQTVRISAGIAIVVIGAILNVLIVYQKAKEKGGAVTSLSLAIHILASVFVAGVFAFTGMAWFNLTLDGVIVVSAVGAVTALSGLNAITELAIVRLQKISIDAQKKLKERD